jgi:hypothetical protein
VTRKVVAKAEPRICLFEADRDWDDPVDNLQQEFQCSHCLYRVYLSISEPYTNSSPPMNTFAIGTVTSTKLPHWRGLMKVPGEAASDFITDHVHSGKVR